MSKMTPQGQINKAQASTNSETDISLKDLFERVISLETKLDLMRARSERDTHFFKNIALMLVSIELINMVLNLLVLKWR